jgi:SHAQKYF class myb-like DNA-binding protein
MFLSQRNKSILPQQTLMGIRDQQRRIFHDDLVHGNFKAKSMEYYMRHTISSSLLFSLPPPPEPQELDIPIGTSPDTVPLLAIDGKQTPLKASQRPAKASQRPAKKPRLKTANIVKQHYLRKVRKFSKWTDEEHRLFLQGVSQYGRQWTKIAALVKSRNAGAVQGHARTHELEVVELLGNVKLYNVWTDEEHRLFLKGISQYGRQWTKIAALVKSRNAGAVQGHARTHVLEIDELLGNVKLSNKWTDEEHRLFLQGVSQYGRQWTKIAALVKSRTPGQLQSHANVHALEVQKIIQKITPP